MIPFYQKQTSWDFHAPSRNESPLACQHSSKATRFKCILPASGGIVANRLEYETINILIYIIYCTICLYIIDDRPTPQPYALRNPQLCECSHGISRTWQLLAGVSVFGNGWLACCRCLPGIQVGQKITSMSQPSQTSRNISRVHPEYHLDFSTSNDFMSTKSQLFSIAAQGFIRNDAWSRTDLAVVHTDCSNTFGTDY